MQETETSPQASFIQTQREKLLRLRDAVLDSINGVAKVTLRARALSCQSSTLTGDLADASSDSWEQEFAVSLLLQEHDALKEIDSALQRIASGCYGICEMSGQPIPRARLEVIPFARCTVECQSKIEQGRKVKKARRAGASVYLSLETALADETTRSSATETIILDGSRLALRSLKVA